ncbi:MAG: ABC transporter ATP-binding protein/permease, partial [Pseudomonadota bacterium]
MTEDSNPAQDRHEGLRVLRDVAPYLWPSGEWHIQLRVVFAMASLICAKLVAVTIPLFYKDVVDALAKDGGVPILALGAVGLTVAYGMSRLMQMVFEQLRDLLFARVSQQALRRLALRTFRHIHRMSLRYHVSRRTGALSRIMDRGVKGVAFLLRFMLFSIGPLVLELVLICAIVVSVFDWRFLLVLVGTFAVYVWFTFAITEWRVKIRKVMNDQDNEASQRAIDSLLNFETVKYFGAERREAERYDTAMAGYESAALKTAYSLSAINAGQALIINAGLVAVMVMAAQGVQAGTYTVGDFVMVNAYMMQIIAPLNFLGFVYREIRQALVDMGQMFTLLDEEEEITDKPDALDLVIDQGRIELDAVRFSYETTREILKGVSFAVEGGQTVAIVGATGSGKSTVGR